MNHVTEQPKGCVRFQTMLDDIAPGLYDVAYRNLSRIAHGNMVFGFRGDMSASTSQSALLRPKKNREERSRALVAIYTSFAVQYSNRWDGSK